MSAFAICCICLLLAGMTGCVFVIISACDTINEQRRSLAAAGDAMIEMDERVKMYVVVTAKLRDKHEAASRRIAELMAEKGGKA